MATVHIEETQWRITRQAPVAAGARAEGDRLPEPPESGLRFQSEKGESLFFPMSYADLPSQDELSRLPLDRVHKMIVDARARARSV